MNKQHIYLQLQDSNIYYTVLLLLNYSESMKEIKMKMVTPPTACLCVICKSGATVLKKERINFLPRGGICLYLLGFGECGGGIWWRRCNASCLGRRPATGTHVLFTCVWHSKLRLLQQLRHLECWQSFLA